MLSRKAVTDKRCIGRDITCLLIRVAGCSSGTCISGKLPAHTGSTVVNKQIVRAIKQQVLTGGIGMHREPLPTWGNS